MHVTFIYQWWNPQGRTLKARKGIKYVLLYWDTSPCGGTPLGRASPVGTVSGKNDFALATLPERIDQTPQAWK